MMGVGAKRAIGLYRSCAPRHRDPGRARERDTIATNEKSVRWRALQDCQSHGYERGAPCRIDGPGETNQIVAVRERGQLR